MSYCAKQVHELITAAPHVEQHPFDIFPAPVRSFSVCLYYTAAHLPSIHALYTSLNIESNFIIALYSLAGKITLEKQANVLSIPPMLK